MTAAPEPSLYSVAIFVTDIERAVEFYRDRLALPMRRRGSFGAEFLNGPTRIGVHPAVHPDSRAIVGRHQLSSLAKNSRLASSGWRCVLITVPL